MNATISNFMKPRTKQLVACTIAVLTLASSLRAHADWPLVRGDAYATGAVKEKLTRPLDVLWTYEAPDSAFEATAAIIDGVVYVGDVDGTFHAIDLKTGKAVWTRKFEDSGFVSGTAVVGDGIYCVDFTGMIRRLKRDGGEEVWHMQTDTELYAPPNVHDSLVLLATEAGDLFALTAADGKEKWKFTIKEPLRCWPTVVDGRVLVAGCDAHLHAVDVTNGTELESIKIGGPADSMPAVLGDKVYFCTAGGVFHAMTTKPLAEVWKFGQSGQGQEIHAAAVCDEAVVLGTHDKRIVAFEPKTGKQKWEFRLRARAQSSPVIVGDLVLFATLRGRVHALELSTGKEVWHEDLGGRFTSSPAVSDGRVVIGSEDGVLYCIGGKGS